MEIERQSSGIGQSAAGKASVKSCFINLANTIVGGGMLGLPYAFSHTGYALGSILMALCAIASGFSLHLLALCSLKQEGPSSFFSLAKEALPKFTAVIDIAVAITCFGAASSFLVIIGDLMPQVMQQFGASSAIQDRQLWVFLGFVVVTPLSCLRNLDSLKFTSVMAMVFVVFLTLLVILYAADIPSLNPCVDVDDGDVCKGSTTDAQVTFKTGQTISVIVFAFGCQQNIFAVVNEIERPTMPRIDAVILLAIVLVFLIYMVVAGCGYKTYGDEVEPDILVSYPTNIVTSIARLAVSLLVAFSYPLQAHPARMCILTLLSTCLDAKDTKSGENPTSPLLQERENDARVEGFGDDNDEHEQDSDDGYRVSDLLSPSGKSKPASHAAHEGSMLEPRYALVTVAFLGMSLAVGLTVTNLSTVQGFAGATGTNAIAFILPGFFYYLLFKDEGPVWKRYAALMLGIIGIIMVPIFLSFMFL
eukprot:CAMPEP_0174964974 /NCGR_PEP_ID=MMETSP0004_2-20121128/6184_1 /TAXON_ID=420556 /ORGANISM="Ochromonas sp., Strain CCMP1393" /LENGTH=475 /DNA_ID=CAMNT_0016213771 /DNA_START=1691 /DNA_END=3118 /DNA_ORIENTATION=+